MANHRCPVCNKQLSESEYQKALDIMGKMKIHFTHQIAHLQEKLKDAKVKESQARRDGISYEKRRSERLTAGLKEKLAKAQDRIRQLRTGSTPQSEGLDLEPAVLSRLKQEFRDDEIQHKGKGGDILQIVLFEKKVAGRIIYECKKCPRIKQEHIDQTAQAKQTRQADFAVLVTTGNKKGFSGFSQVNGIFIVHPFGAVAIASLLRVHLIEMLRAKIAKSRRAAIAQNLMEFVTSPHYKNRIEEIVHTSMELQTMVEEEAHAHYRVWKKRLQLYKTIEWDGTVVQENVRLVLHGKEPNQIVQRLRVPLKLPPVPTET
jgi:hypothetical protein